MDEMSALKSSNRKKSGSMVKDDMSIIKSSIVEFFSGIDNTVPLFFKGIMFDVLLEFLETVTCIF